MNRRTMTAAIGLLAALAAGCTGGTSPDRDTTGLAEQEAVAKALAPSLVRVEFTLRYDKGEPPASGDRFFSEDRPGEVPGYLVSPTRVLVMDPADYPRFIEKVNVRLGDDVAPAKFVAWATTHDAAFLELERPLKGGQPLAFDARKGPPYLSVVGGERGGGWVIQVQKYAPSLSVFEDGRLLSSAPNWAILTDEQGSPVGAVMDGEIPADNSWKGSPLDWPTCSAEEHQRLMADFAARADRAVVRITLYFRSPSKEAPSRRYYGRGNEENSTEINVTGVLVEGGKVLVLADLQPKVTARLERIVVHPAAGGDVEARFAGSLRDYEGLVATLEKPIDGAVAISDKPVYDYDSRLLVGADVRVQGENRTVYMTHRRITSFRLGWHRHVYPQAYGRPGTLFLFDTDGSLAALPVTQREKVSLQSSSSNRPDLVFATYLKDVLGNLAAHTDPANVPLSENEEHRLAWLGVELQRLNQELARINNVSQLTRDGDIGAVVAYVYPGSPAAKAGVEPGWILLRLIVEGQPKPIDVQVESDYGDGPFPWDELDHVSEQSFERIPTPWPSAENTFRRTLTDLGFGTKFKAEFSHDGRLVTKDFEIAQSPTHYESAPRFKSQALGITVRDVTFELRRYFQKKDDEPGVIISKIEPGGKASVAGIKPYEIITHINDKPILNVKDFEAAIQNQDELKLEVKRMTRGRVAKIVMNAPTPAKAGPAVTEKPAPAAMTAKPAAAAATGTPADASKAAGAEKSAGPAPTAKP